MTIKKDSDNLKLLKHYRELIEKIESILSEMISPEKSQKEEIDFPYDMFIDESGAELVIEVEMPGLTLENTSIKGFDKFLEISGNKDTLRSNRYKNCVCLERENGFFKKIIYLNRSVNFNESKVFIENGILAIRLPIVEEKRGIVKINAENRGEND